MNRKLTDENVELISKLAEIQSNRTVLDSRLQTFERKAQLVRDAIDNGNQEESEIIEKLREEGLLYGNVEVNTETPVVEDKQGDAKEQLFAMFNDFLASRGNSAPIQAPTSAPVQAPTSAPIYTSSNPYTFPSNETSTMTPLMSPTSGPPIRATPIGMSPTSG